MSTVNAEIKWQGNDDAWFTANASEIFDANIQIFHIDGRYKFTDGITALSALPFRGSGSNYTLTTSEIGSVINGADSATPNDTDLVISVESSVAKKNTWTQIKSFLKTYFDTIYTTTSAVASQITSALSGYVAKVNNNITTGITRYSSIQRSILGNLNIKQSYDDPNDLVQKVFDVDFDDNNVAIKGSDNISGYVTIFKLECGKLTIESTDPLFKVALNNLTPSQIVETDANKNLISAAKQTGYNLPLGTTAGTVLEGSQYYLLQDLVNQFRLTLTSGVAVTTGDVVNASTIYCTPYNGNKISLYNGTNWVNYTSNEFSLALGTLLNKRLYDVFCYANAGVPTLEFTVWTNDTKRATALTLQNGVLVKSGDATRRYLGTFYNQGNQSATVTISNATPAVITYTGHGLTANTPVVFSTTGALPSGLVAGTTYYVASLGTITANTFNVSLTPGGALINTSTAGSGTHTCTVPTYTEDSVANRYLWNYYNQAPRKMYTIDSSVASWSYTTAVYRQSNSNQINQLNFILGIDSVVSAIFKATVQNSSAGVASRISLGLDSTSSIFTQSRSVFVLSTANNAESWHSFYDEVTALGKHYLASLENSNATGTATWVASSSNLSGLLLG